MQVVVDFGTDNGFLFEETCFPYKDILSEYQCELIEDGLILTDEMLHFKQSKITQYDEDDQKYWEELSVNRIAFDGHFSAFMKAYVFMMALLKNAPDRSVGVITKVIPLDNASTCYFNVTFCLDRGGEILDDLLNVQPWRNKETFGTATPVFVTRKVNE